MRALQSQLDTIVTNKQTFRQQMIQVIKELSSQLNTMNNTLKEISFTKEDTDERILLQQGQTVNSQENKQDEINFQSHTESQIITNMKHRKKIADNRSDVGKTLLSTKSRREAVETTVPSFKVDRSERSIT